MPTLTGMLQPVSSPRAMNSSRAFNRKGSRNCQARKFSHRIWAEMVINPSAKIAKIVLTCASVVCNEKGWPT